jgi:hypothetical protein
MGNRARMPELLDGQSGCRIKKGRLAERPALVAGHGQYQ